MLELPKSARFRMLIVGVMLVKLALFLFLYQPVLGLSPQPSIAPQEATAAPPSPLPALRSGAPPAEDSKVTPPPPRGSLGSAPMLGVLAEPSVQGNPAEPSPWRSVKELAAALERQRTALADKELRLRQEAEQLETLKGLVKRQMEELTHMRARATEALQKKGAWEDEELNRLARLYEATTPEQSGALLGRIDAKIAAQILARMSGAKAGKVLSSIEPARAVRISEQLLKKE